MLEKSEVPLRPSQRPRWSMEKECNTLRNWFHGELQKFDSVEIEFTATDSDCECDDDEGAWTVEAYKNNQRFYAESPSFIDAMWFVMEHANAKSREHYLQRQLERNSALAKLTIHERSILGVS